MADRDNLIALREAVSSISGLVQTITEPTWEEKEAIKSVHRMNELAYQAELEWNTLDLEAQERAEIAGLTAMTLSPEFVEKDTKIHGMGWTTRATMERYAKGLDEGVAHFQGMDDQFRLNLVNVGQAWSKFGKDHEAVQEAIHDATTAIRVLDSYIGSAKSLRKGRGWAGRTSWLAHGVQVAKDLEEKKRFYVNLVNQLQQDPQISAVRGTKLQYTTEDY